MANIDARLIVRKGNLQDLPILDSGEMGYAENVNRLFIGNNPLTQTGDGSTTQFNFGIDLTGPAFLYSVDIDGVQAALTVNTSNDFIMGFTTAPADGSVITLKYNTEILIKQPPEGMYDAPVSAELVPGPVTGELFTPITIDSARFNDIKIRYTIINNNASTEYRRSGTLSISLGDADFVIDDTYTINFDPAVNANLLDHTFDGTMTTGVFVLNYTTNDPDTATTMSFVQENFAAASPN